MSDDLPQTKVLFQLRWQPNISGYICVCIQYIHIKITVLFWEWDKKLIKNLNILSFDFLHFLSESFLKSFVWFGKWIFNCEHISRKVFFFLALELLFVSPTIKSRVGRQCGVYVIYLFFNKEEGCWMENI